MKDLRNNKVKIIILILVFLIILFILLKIVQNRKFNFQEDIIFFKLFSVQESTKDEDYEIEVVKGKRNFQKIDLAQTVDIKTLVDEKIAPGAKGSFYVYLTSNSNMNYEIEIIDKNESPKNFQFKIDEENGKLEKNKTKKIEINWDWPYEINEKENIQDTKDGKNIEKYAFEICAIGK